MHTKLSISSATKAINLSKEAQEKIKSNITILDNNVNSYYSNLTDPTIIKYQQLVEKMDELLKMVTNRMEDISAYCEKVIAWIKEYNNI